MSILHAVLASSVLLGLTDPGDEDEIVYRPAAETVLERTIVNAYSMRLASMALSLNGEPMPEDSFGTLDITVEHEEKYVVLDRFVRSSPESPSHLRRTFEVLTGSEHATYASEEGAESRDTSYESVLEGTTVAFTWSEGGSECEALFDPPREEGADLLAGLDEDMDLRRLLPGGGASVGDSWSIDPLAFQCILDPGGELGLKDTLGASRDTSATDAQLRRNLRGTIEARYERIEERDDLRLAVVSLRVEAQTRSEEALAQAELLDGEEGTSQVEASFSLSGEMLWDVTHGHACALELAGKNELSMSSLIRELGGEGHQQSQTMVFAGEMTFSMRFVRK